MGIPTKTVWLIDAVRTPIGKHGGMLSSLRPDDLGALVLKAIIDRTHVPVKDIEDVYLGCANQAGEDNRNVARMSLLLAGFPVEIAGCTVNRLCGSGLEALSDAARCIMAGEGNVYVGGGVESMSRNGSPYRADDVRQCICDGSGRLAWHGIYRGRESQH